MAEVHKGAGSFSADAYSPDGKFLGTIETSDELVDFRIQVSQEHVAGYYLMLNGEKLMLDETAIIEPWPEELDYYTRCLVKLVHLRFNIKDKDVTV